MKLPLKTRILQYAINKGSDFTVQDVLQDLQSEYEGEAIFTPKHVEEYVDSFLGVGFFKAAQLEFDSQDNLVIHCVITEYGRERDKYLPKE
ncbi:MAG: hypothetical protein LKF74_05075 [Megasphaera sp.]|jgi:hypothetical protein|nr:hypothetical protein [Megasphaera sp.]MCH4188185.1 hypothetical protein [Megasphaera sp.]MCH4217913.1 hypothetical protein [Megasphaera sp.]